MNILFNMKIFLKHEKIMLYINMWKIRPSLFVDLFPSSDITSCTCIKFEHSYYIQIAIFNIQLNIQLLYSKLRKNPSHVD